MSKNTWMPLYIGDYLADTSRLTTEQHGAYMLLIMDYWRNGAPPDDDVSLSNITRLSISQWKKHRPTLVKMFKVIDGEWKHKRIEREMDSASEASEKYTKRAKTAAEKRWNKQPTSNEEAIQIDATSNATSINQALHEECPSPSPSQVLDKSNTTTLQRERVDSDFLKKVSEVFQHATQKHSPLLIAGNHDIQQWVTSGMDVYLDIIPVIDSLIERQTSKGKEVNTFKYFTEAIANANATRTTPMPLGTPSKTQGNSYAKSTTYPNKTDDFAATAERIRAKYATPAFVG